MKKKYRDNGAIGAILDEYEKALTELENVISNISYEDLTVIVDHKTEDADCKSIQAILTHVIKAGYGYVIEIRNSLGEQIDFIERNTFFFRLTFSGNRNWKVGTVISFKRKVIKGYLLKSFSQ